MTVTGSAQQHSGGDEPAAVASSMLQGVPVIDAANFLSQDAAQLPPPHDVVQAVREAAVSWGFFQLVNHGLSRELLDAHYAAMQQFFAQPPADKQAIKRTAANAMGYFNDELTKQKVDLKEGYDVRCIHRPELPDDHPHNADPVQGHNQWPAQPPEFRAITQRYMAEMTRVSFRLLEVLALGLGLPAHALHAFFQPSHTSFLRLNYYPLLPGARGLGISPHKDAGFLTVLIQDSVAGLQVQRNGAWHTVQPLPNALTINIGDMAQVLSNDALYASEHRVLQSAGAVRYSRAFFFNPALHAHIAPRTDLAVAGKMARYRPIPWAEFRAKRIAGDLADRGEEVQIHHWRQPLQDGPQQHDSQQDTVR